MQPYTLCFLFVRFVLYMYIVYSTVFRSILVVERVGDVCDMQSYIYTYVLLVEYYTVDMSSHMVIVSDTVLLTGGAHHQYHDYQHIYYTRYVHCHVTHH